MESSDSKQPPPLEDRYPDFVWIAHRFHTHIDALREMLNDFVPQLREADVQRVSPEALSAIGTLSAEKREALRKAIEESFERAEQRRADGAQPESSAIPLNVRDIFEGDQHALGRFLENLVHALSSPRRQEIMLSSLLAMAVGGFEVLVTAVIQRFYVAHPEALEGNDASFGLADLARFRDLDDAREFLISRKVTDLMMGGYESWSDWLKRQCKADMDGLAMGPEAVVEIFQRRHVVMHSGGFASHLYIEKVRPAERDGIEVGTALHPSMDYMNAALDELDVLGTLLLVQAWGTWRTSERDGAAAILLQRSYRLMLLGRWAAVRKLCSVGEKLKAQGATRWALACNGWHATQKTEGREAILVSVEQWDTSALAGRFRLVQLVLLGDIESAWGMIPTLLEHGEITRGALREWPILEDLRAHQEVHALLEGEASNGELQASASSCEDEDMDH